MKFIRQPEDDPDILENGEGDRLQNEPKMRDASTSMSQEHLSLMIKYNQMGSLTSLSRSKVRSVLYHKLN
jgi:hypothetical protein